LNESGLAAARRWRAALTSSATAGHDETFDVVFVCTGNRFRSPLAAALLHKRTENVELLVTSAGTLDLGDVPPLPEATEHGRRLGVDLSSHRPRYIGSLDLRDADLVLGFEQIHIATAVVEADARRDRTFTLPELVELLDVSAATPREVVAAAHATRRGGHGPSHPAEIRDPLGGGSLLFLTVADEIDDLVTRLVRGLFG
jgi:protein-tyrosine phosphatase